MFTKWRHVAAPYAVPCTATTCTAICTATCAATCTATTCVPFVAQVVQQQEDTLKHNKRTAQPFGGSGSRFCDERCGSGGGAE